MEENEEPAKEQGADTQEVASRIPADKARRTGWGEWLSGVHCSRRRGHRPEPDSRGVNERQGVQRVSRNNSEKSESVEEKKDGGGAKGHAGLKERFIFQNLVIF